MSEKRLKCCKNCTYLHCMYILPNSRQYCMRHNEFFDTNSCCRGWEYGETKYLKLKAYEYLKIGSENNE